MINNFALTIQSTPKSKSIKFNTFFLVDRTITTTEDERSDCETGDCDTVMFHPQFYVPFTGVEWGGLYLKFSPFIANFN